jgi:sialic acid synthase SpsE
MEVEDKYPKCRWVAEIGSNHNGELHRVFKLIKLAKEVGAWGVKFQFVTGSLYDDQKIRHPLFPATSRIGLAAVQECAHNLGLFIGYTVFTRSDPRKLAKHCDWIKISSYDLPRLDLIKSAARATEMLVLSTGMAYDEEIIDAYEVAKTHCNDITLLHCISEYPAPANRMQLTNIERIVRIVPTTRTGEPIARKGLSDHSCCPAVLYRAVLSWQSTMVEFHLDDGRGMENSHSWKPRTIKQVINYCKLGEQADGRSLRSFSNDESVERAYRANKVSGTRPVPGSHKEVD